MRTLTLDPSKKTGFCHGIIGDRALVSGSYKLPDLELSGRATSFERWLMMLIQGNSIIEVYFERPILPKVTSFDAVCALMSYAIVIGMACKKSGIHSYAIDQQTWRSEVGLPTQAPKKIAKPEDRRKWMKDRSIERCLQDDGYTTVDDNEADARNIFKCIEKRRMARIISPEFDLLSTLPL